MIIGSMIAQHRKRLGMTQEALAQKLGVTNQAVSKWESDQSCPDIQLLPELAELFGITIDELFGRKMPETPGEEPEAHCEAPRKTIFGFDFDKLFDREMSGPQPEKTWEDDNVLRVVLYQGHKLLKHVPAGEKLTFEYDGPALKIDSMVSVYCGDVAGTVDAGCDVNCGNVGGNVDAGSCINCGNVEGDADAGSDIKCGNVGGSVDAGSYVNCGDVGGDVDAGGSVTCGSVSGSVDAGGTVSIQK